VTDAPRKPRIALVGNPNSGKTTLFNALTGTQQTVGNWPGVTVERKTGELRHGSLRIDVVDLPGTYSLVAGATDPLDQRIAQDYVVEGGADLYVNVVDASCLDRSLFLTSQLLDAGRPVAVALNMIDVAHSHGVHLDPAALAARLGTPVVAVVASRGEGVGVLEDVIQAQLDRAGAAPAGPHLDDPGIAEALPALRGPLGVNSALAAEIRIRLLSDPATQVDPEIRAGVEQLLDGSDETLEARFVRARFAWVSRVQEGAVQETPVGRTLTDRLDDLFLNRWLGIPLFLGVMYVMFLFSINVGSAFIDFFDQAAGVFVVDLPRWGLESLAAPAWLTALVADGLGGGIQLVASFIPVIGCLFLFLTFLEDSGYMARAAFLVDRALRAVGLPGKAFVPLIVGFGCNVPSVMATRTLEREQDRILTAIMAPFMSCGARLTVYALFAAAFFPVGGQNIVFALYLTGIAVAVLSAFVLRSFVMPRGESPFLLELPAYHVPTLRGLLLQTWHRLRAFAIRAGKAIVAVVVIINFLNSMGTDGTFGNQDSDKSVLSEVGRQIVPVFAPMGLEEENWPAAVGIFTGIFAKEVVVGTLDALYGQLTREAEGAGAAGAGDDAGGPEFPDVPGALGAALGTIPANLADLGGAVLDPLGFDIVRSTDLEAAAEAQDVSTSTITTMQVLFGTPLAAFAYLLFVLLYFPCVATIGAIYREQGPFWAVYSGLWSLVIAYALAVVVYQLGQLPAQPAVAVAWTTAMAALVAATLAGLVRAARRETERSRLIPVLEVRGP
jgi:ferrous iron transport protein B